MVHIPELEDTLIRILVKGIGKVELTDYSHFWIEDPGFGGGGSCPMSIHSFVEHVIRNRDGFKNRYIVFSRKEELFGIKDRTGLYIMVSDIVGWE